MKNLVIIILTTIIIMAGYLVGYPVYQLKQTENAIRNKLQTVNISHIINHDNNKGDMSDKLFELVKNNLIRIETNNQYPNFQVNVIATDVDLLKNIKPLNEILPLIIKNTKELQKDYLCQKMIDNFKNEPNNVRQALINVLEKDELQFEIILQKEDGSKIDQYNQKAIECLGLWATSSI